jgi:hypothetical protein
MSRRGTDSFRDSRARAETHLAASSPAAESSGRTTAGLSQGALTASNSSASDFRKAANRSATRHSTSCAGRRAGLGDGRQNRVALTAKHSTDDVCHAYKRRSHWLCRLRYLRPGASEPGAPGFRPSIHRIVAVGQKPPAMLALTLDKASQDSPFSDRKTVA